MSISFAYTKCRLLSAIHMNEKSREMKIDILTANYVKIDLLWH